MPKVEVDNFPPGEFNGDWKKYKMFLLMGENGPYKTGYRLSDGKQLRRYEYISVPFTDEQIPNSIEEINKLANYNDTDPTSQKGRKLWMKLYMRASRKHGWSGGGTRKNPQKSKAPDSRFQGSQKRKNAEKLIKESKKEEKKEYDGEIKKQKEQAEMNDAIDEMVEESKKESKKKKVIVAFNKFYKELENTTDSDDTSYADYDRIADILVNRKYPDDWTDDKVKTGRDMSAEEYKILYKGAPQNVKNRVKKIRQKANEQERRKIYWEGVEKSRKEEWENRWEVNEWEELWRDNKDLLLKNLDPDSPAYENLEFRYKPPSWSNVNWMDDTSYETSMLKTKNRRDLDDLKKLIKDTKEEQKKKESELREKEKQRDLQKVRDEIQKKKADKEKEKETPKKEKEKEDKVESKEDKLLEEYNRYRDKISIWKEETDKVVEELDDEYFFNDDKEPTKEIEDRHSQFERSGEKYERELERINKSLEKGKDDLFTELIRRTEKDIRSKEKTIKQAEEKVKEFEGRVKDADTDEKSKKILKDRIKTLEAQIRGTYKLTLPRLEKILDTLRLGEVPNFTIVNHTKDKEFSKKLKNKTKKLNKSKK